MTDRRDFFEDLVFGSMGSRRFTQDSPILPEVWIAYGMNPGVSLELLLTPHVNSTSVELARRLRARFDTGARRFDSRSREARAIRKRRKEARIAPNQTAVAAKLTFEDLIQLALPMTAWWRNYLIQGKGHNAVELYHKRHSEFGFSLVTALKADRFEEWQGSRHAGDKVGRALPAHLVWLARVTGTIAKVTNDGVGANEGEASALERLNAIAEDPVGIRDALFGLFDGLVGPDEDIESTDAETENQGSPTPLWAAGLNRNTENSIYRSNKSTKADAVRRLFSVRGRKITWAVIDSGIDARHIAFRKRKGGSPLGPDGKPLKTFMLSDDAGAVESGAFYKEPDFGRWVNQTRIRASYDFNRIRDLLSGDPDSLDGVPGEMIERATALGLKDDLRKALKFGSMIDWGLLGKIIEVPHDDRYKPPVNFHGTHVAGIIGADWRADEHNNSPATDRTGIAPEIELYDLRALDDGGNGNEFSVMAAMQFVRHLNLRKTGHNQMEVHGANLSFAIRHEVSNFACGRTPVCDEAERLVGNGVVVVAAAGNQGRARYQTTSGKIDEGYRGISITDPGNAEAVITVGATHRSKPHTYGVSYFSSRGPTGDGRMKPDLVAPGEKIYSTVPNNGEKNADGSSQAAPHVRGAAALLMARNRELIGRPDRVKEILCDSATDLGRERYFQGAGMLDILRALQSV